MNRKFLLLFIETVSGSLLAILESIAFFILAGYLVPRHTAGLDTAAFGFFLRYVSPSVNRFMQFVSVLGNFNFLLYANCVLILYFLLVRKNNWRSITSTSVALSSVLLMFLLKQWFNRPRPPVPLLEPALGLSFPSGHAMSSVTFYGLLIYFAWSKKSISYRVRLLIVFLLVLLILLIGLSRVYLRVHYASDVLGGFLAGYIWLSVSLYAIRRIEEYSKKRVARSGDLL